MAPLPYAFRAWLFLQALDDIQAAYKAAAQALSSRPDEIEEEVRRRLGIGPTDAFPDRNDDNEEDYVGRLYDEAGDLEERADRGAHFVRKAFLIALFHHWERHCNAELKRATYGHPRGWLSQRGKSPYAKEILELERAANCAKHGPVHSCQNLFKMAPDLFPTVATAAKASERTLAIDGSTLDRFFEVVRKAAS
ncbi:hypothetical protein EH240_27575 [Mesorhizobium tamadayense]|uniref:Uncharacterized protein n=1 Tax=Mesorhizobium tamadayense TaxID=425306 RepID=A0A3P3F6J0_9HYPH|nr:hypothetical protein [Mesorhizobium tamadayense]RRH94244.1 hypothetical protein EH240_27575 [Mesorhizobium tamadayense]